MVFLTGPVKKGAHLSSAILFPHCLFLSTVCTDLYLIICDRFLLESMVKGPASRHLCHDFFFFGILGARDASPEVDTNLFRTCCHNENRIFLLFGVFSLLFLFFIRSILLLLLLLLRILVLFEVVFAIVLRL